MGLSMHRTLFAALAIVLAITQTSGAEATANCPAERAVYTLKSDPAFSAGFIPAKHFASMASNLYFWIKSPQRTYWFSFGIGNGYTGISLGPVGDPYIAADGDPDNGPARIEPEEASHRYLRIYPMLPDFDVLESPPSAGDPAPQALFAPEIGTLLWYSPQDATLDKTAQRDPMDRGVFLLSGCLETAPPPALP